MYFLPFRLTLSKVHLPLLSLLLFLDLRFFPYFCTVMLHILYMCNSATDNPTIIRRNDDFIAVYNNVLRRFPCIPLEDAVVIAIHSPAREFYISELYAIKYCYALASRRGTRLKRGTAKHQCVSTIYLMARNHAAKHNVSLRDAVIAVIYNQAPRFYINRSTAYAIIKGHRN